MRRLVSTLSLTLLLVVTSTALAAAMAPKVATGGAKATTASSATLTGNVNPNGQPTTYYFQYGTTTGYSSGQTSMTSAGSGTKNVPASAPVSSLTPNTLYHYRLVAQNASGTTFGADKTFTTAKAPAAPPAPGAPAVMTGGAKAVTENSATVTGTVNPNGQATTYYFQYGTTTSYSSGQTSMTGAGSGTKNVLASAPVSSLTPNTLYHYRLVAQNATGTTFGADRTFKTGMARVTLAAAPGTLTFGQATTLSGAVTGAHAPRARVTLERGRSAGGPFTPFASTTADAKGKYSFTGVRPDANTWYRTLANGSASAPVFVLVHFRVSLFVSNAFPRAGSLIRFFGRVAPRHNGLLVFIQRLGAGGRWRTLAHTRLRPASGNASRFSVRVKVRRSGFYRVMTRPDATHARGFSRLVRLHVH